MTLSEADHAIWLALRRVDSGGVAIHEGRYYDRGGPLGRLLTDVLEGLRKQGMVELTDPSPQDGLARATLTAAGTDRYAAMCERQEVGARAPMPRRPLSAPDRDTFSEWVALCRVTGGNVSRKPEGYVDHGRLVVGDIARALDRLIDAGALALGPPRPTGHRAVCLTTAGQRRHAAHQL